MSDLFDDIATAFNETRLQVADGFDKMRADNMKFYRTHAQAWVDSVYEQYGDDGWGALLTYPVAFLASTGDVLLDFVQGVGAATFFDPLRLGEGVKEGTPGGYFEDGLRVVGVVGGAIKLLKFGKFVVAAGELRGGALSCTASSGAKALIHGEIKSVPTIFEIAKGTGGGVSVRLPTYPGAYIADIVPNLRKAGATVDTVNVGDIKDIVRLVNQNKGPVLFSVEWTVVGDVREGHTMMAYRPFFASGIRLADQYGNLHTLENVGDTFRVIAGRGTSSAGIIGASAYKAGDVLGQIKNVYADAYVLRDALLLDVAANAPLAQRVGVPLFTALDDQFNIKLGYAASQLSTAPSKLRLVGEYVKKAIAANPGGSPSDKGKSPQTKTSGIPLGAAAQKLLAVIGAPGSVINGRSLFQKAAVAGIGQFQYYPALQELEGWGKITVQRGPGDPNNILSVTRN